MFGCKTNKPAVRPSVSDIFEMVVSHIDSIKDIDSLEFIDTKSDLIDQVGLSFSPFFVSLRESDCYRWWSQIKEENNTVSRCVLSPHRILGEKKDEPILFRFDFGMTKKKKEKEKEKEKRERNEKETEKQKNRNKNL